MSQCQHGHHWRGESAYLRRRLEGHELLLVLGKDCLHRRREPLRVLLLELIDALVRAVLHATADTGTALVSGLHCAS